MAKEIGMVKPKSKRSGVGSFFLGGFIGFVLCLVLIAGALCFVYFKVSSNWINKTFKTEIDLGSEEANKKTVKQLVSAVISLAENLDTYTLTKLKTDFGVEIEDELFGINIIDLKNVAFKDLPDAIENKFGTITANELKEVSGMKLEEEMGNILDKEIVYYFNEENNKLYLESNYTKPAGFDFELNSTKDEIKVKGHTESIVDGKVTIQLWYLPLSVAVGDFAENLGDNITLWDLEHSYGVNLPTFFKFTEQEKKDTTINELQTAINGLYVADFLGYSLDLSNPDKAIVKKSDGTVVDGFEATIAKFKIEELSDGMGKLKVKDIFSDEEFESGIMSLIDKETYLTELADEVSDVVTTKTIDNFITAKIVNTPKGYNNTTKNNWILVGKDQSNNNIYKQVKDLMLQDVVNVMFEYVDVSALPSTKPAV